MSNRALWATSTAPRANSKNIGSTASMVGASHTIAVVMPVSCTICGGMLRCGSTRVANSPSTTPPRTLTAPISVMASGVFSLGAPSMRPPGGLQVDHDEGGFAQRHCVSARRPSIELGETQLIRAGRTHGRDVKHSHRQPRCCHAGG